MKTEMLCMRGHVLNFREAVKLPDFYEYKVYDCPICQMAYKDYQCTAREVKDA